MSAALKCFLAISLLSASSRGEDARRRLLMGALDDDVPDDLTKRSGQDEFGPFWANRGKKSPAYAQQRLFTQEPGWILVRRDEPFLHSRGRKDASTTPNENALRDLWRHFNRLQLRDRREDADFSPFFAARG